MIILLNTCVFKNDYYYRPVKTTPYQGIYKNKCFYTIQHMYQHVYIRNSIVLISRAAAGDDI